MKKLIFATIAVVAFNSISIAKTIDTIKIVDNCPSTAMHMMDIVEAETGTIDDIIDYNNLYQYYLNMCYNGQLNLGKSTKL